MSRFEDHEVKTVKRFLVCDCGEEMKWDGLEITTYPPKYQHECPKCGKRETQRSHYPRIEVVP